MFSALRRRLTYANVTATLALFLALGGTAYSAAGGNFILGQVNDAGTQATRLSANANASTLRLTNTHATGKGNIVVSQGSGVRGISSAANGLEGVSTSNAGSGVLGENTSDGWALKAVGNATQTVRSGGFIKAMASVNPSTGAITNCFNSQISPSLATIGTCQIAEYDNGPGASFLIFNGIPAVEGRVLSVTPTSTSDTPRSISVSKGPGYVYVTISDSAGNFVDEPYDVVVF